MLSIVIPIFNEEENINILYTSIMEMLNKNNLIAEIIFVNDGSSDNSLKELEKISVKDDNIKIINFRRNYGQTAAMSAGIDHSSGDLIIPMDGDNQNDPNDIPRLINKINEGFDVVSGWRKDRKDKKLSRIIPSIIANRVISKIGGVPLHDYGCSLKAYKREVIKDVKLYGEMHRFIPIYASWQGAKVAELVVNHHPRRFGKTKYGINRTFKVLLDLILIKFMEVYMQKPIYLFGGFAMINLFMAIISFVVMIYFKFLGGKSFVQTPLPQIVILFFLVGVLSLFIGFLSEIMMRTYYESQGQRSYSIKNKINF